MTELKYGGNDVGKIMFNGQEFGGANKLESGTIIYTGDVGENIHLLSSGKKWKNLNKKIRVKTIYTRNGIILIDKVVDLESLPVTLGSGNNKLNLSKSEIDDDYGLNAVSPQGGDVSLEITAL